MIIKYLKELIKDLKYNIVVKDINKKIASLEIAIDILEKLENKRRIKNENINQ